MCWNRFRIVGVYGQFLVRAATDRRLVDFYASAKILIPRWIAATIQFLISRSELRVARILRCRNWWGGRCRSGPRGQIESIATSAASLCRKRCPLPSILHPLLCWTECDSFLPGPLHVKLLKWQADVDPSCPLQNPMRICPQMISVYSWVGDIETCVAQFFISQFSLYNTYMCTVLIGM